MSPLLLQHNVWDHCSVASLFEAKLHMELSESFNAEEAGSNGFECNCFLGEQ